MFGGNVSNLPAALEAVQHCIPADLQSADQVVLVPYWVVAALVAAAEESEAPEDENEQRDTLVDP